MKQFLALSSAPWMRFAPMPRGGENLSPRREGSSGFAIWKEPLLLLQDLRRWARPLGALARPTPPSLPGTLTIRSGGGVLRIKHLIWPFSPWRACWVWVLEMMGGPVGRWHSSGTLPELYSLLAFIHSQSKHLQKAWLAWDGQ